jgi:leucyl-tRNA synthetase
MLSPLCPHLGEELWARLGHSTSITFEPFPAADSSLLIDDTIEYPVQVNGKVRARLTVPADVDPKTVESLALADDKVTAVLAGDVPRKVIVVPGRMINIVV